MSLAYCHDCDVLIPDEQLECDDEGEAPCPYCGLYPVGHINPDGGENV